MKPSTVCMASRLASSGRCQIPPVARDAVTVATTAPDRWVGEPVRVLDLTP